MQKFIYCEVILHVSGVTWPDQAMLEGIAVPVL